MAFAVVFEIFDELMIATTWRKWVAAGESFDYFQEPGGSPAGALDAIEVFAELLPENRLAVHQIPKVALMSLMAR